MPFRRPRTELRRGDKIIAVKAIGRTPEGAKGRIQVVDGFKWTRYWVLWDTGEWTGSVDAGSVVAASRYEAYKHDQAEAAARTAAAPAPAALAAAAPAAEGGGSGIPQHLLERSRLARERKAAAG
jgi:hypothetical protein